MDLRSATVFILLLPPIVLVMGSSSAMIVRMKQGRRRMVVVMKQAAGNGCLKEEAVAGWRWSGEEVSPSSFNVRCQGAAIRLMTARGGVVDDDRTSSCNGWQRWRSGGHGGVIEMAGGSVVRLMMIGPAVVTVG